MQARQLFASCCVLLIAQLSHAADIEFDKERLARVATRMSDFMLEREIAGAVTVVATKDHVQQLTVSGKAHISMQGEADRPMREDSIFRIASMTKPITITALMMLVDEGKVAIDDPISKWIPAFAGQKLKDGSAARPVTIRDAVTHTAGLNRGNGQDAARDSLEQTADKIGSAPLAFPPGTKWQYSSGLTVIGRVIEVVSGKSYPDFLRERIFKPLGMKDTTFTLTQEQAKRLATCYEPAENTFGMGVSTHWLTSLDPTKAVSPMPSGGLFSTARDLVTFYQMILRGGEFDGRRFLSSKSVSEMTRIHTAEEIVTGFTPGNAWGLGWCVVKQPQGVSRHLSPGSFGHGGAFGTQAWIDPQRGLIHLLLIQRTKFGNADGSQIRDAFHDTVARSIRGRESKTARVIKYFNYDKAVELTSGKTRVVLCPQAGGRVLEYSHDGQNALYFDEKEKEWEPGKSVPMSAGRFDIGPELVLPRRPTLWAGEWTAEITGPHSARLVSQHEVSLGLQLIRDFTLDPKSHKLTCKQSIANTADWTVETCHWSRTFSTGNGICVIPTTTPSRFPKQFVMYEESSLINFNPQDPNIRERDGMIEIKGVPRRPKLGFDSYAGWMAYATRENLLFIKRFKTYPDRVYNEAAGLTVSVWYPEGLRVELEPIGPRERLAPGQLSSFTEEWFIKPFKFPTEGDLDLVKVREIVKSLGE